MRVELCFFKTKHGFSNTWPKCTFGRTSRHQLTKAHHPEQDRVVSFARRVVKNWPATRNIVDVPWEAQHQKRQLPYRHERRRIYGLVGPEGVSHHAKLELGHEPGARARLSEVSYGAHR